MKSFIKYTIQFLFLFCVFYYGTKLVIGVSASGGKFYSPFVAHYFNYIAWVRRLLLKTSAMALGCIGVRTHIAEPFMLTMQNGIGIKIVYSCIGFGVMSFWSAFVLANSGAVKKKALWLVGGLCLIFFINVVRISLFLLSLNNKACMPFNMNNHLFFNILAYTAIFVMIYFYDKWNNKTA